MNIESLAAYKRVTLGTAEKVRQQVLSYIKERGSFGATADEVAVAFQCSHNHVAPRITELKGSGSLIPSAQRRQTRSGSPARVWLAPDLKG